MTVPLTLSFCNNLVEIINNGPLNVENYTRSLFSLEWRNATPWVRAFPKTSG